MPARTIGDSTDAMPQQEASLHSAGAPDIENVPLKARTKRQRPTFGDGSTTRIFKFPSKTYPRSSYYVTGTEIIIRIKKARKKWKLVVPKKRVVSYRTNRWFAKPRWVELKLTYTQASKLGLAEPRSHSTEVGSGSSAILQMATHPIVEDDRLLTSDCTPVRDSTLVKDSRTKPEADQSELFMPADECGSEADLFHLENDTAVTELHPVTENSPQQTGSGTNSYVGRNQLMSVVAARRRPSLALGLSVFVAAWTMQIDFSVVSTTDSAACARAEPPATCSQLIVTGSLAEVDRPPELATPETPAKHSPLEPGATAVGILQPPNFVVERDILAAATQTQNSHALQLGSSVDHHDCRELSALGRAINIQFDYASSILNPSVLTSLNAFAERLRSCPSVKVIIEGHTDSDGRASRNRTLSIQRARMVLKHIAKSSATPGQLAAIGFGQSRPYLPNVSSMNKRSNRRAVLVVEVAGSP
jgi:outer membrane protein OmpA-like peptidoglycan-associated protein